MKSTVELLANESMISTPTTMIEPLTDLFVRVLDGHNAHLSSDVERLLGRPARNFTDHARAAAATGAWSTEGRR